jgi:hypothetical protein
MDHVPDVGISIEMTHKHCESRAAAGKKNLKSGMEQKSVASEFEHLCKSRVH